MNYGGGYEAYGSEEYGGGGFLEPSTSQGGTAGGSQATPTKGGRGGGSSGRSRETQTLLPVTVRQVLGATEADGVLRIDGHEVSSVRLVGLLNGVTPHSTSINFQVDDGTGTIEGRVFLSNDDGDLADAEMAKLRDGVYVRVVGSLRTFQDRLSLSSFAVTPIEDFNEITHHLLEAIYVHCYNTKGPLHAEGADAKMGTAAANPFQAQPQQTWNQGAAATTSGSMDYDMEGSFTPEQKAILDVLGTCTSDRGVKVDQIYQAVHAQMSEEQLRDALNYLTSEGHVYSTIDENHYKRTT